MESNEKIYEKINQMAVDIGQIKTQLAMMPAPPKQPCQWQLQVRKELDAHVNEHKKTSHDWKSSLIRTGMNLLETALVGFVGLAIGLLIGGVF